MPTCELQVVRSVLRRLPPLDPLRHLALIVSSFLGPAPTLSLSRACAFGSIELLDWIWESSCTPDQTRPTGWALCHYLRSDPRYYRWEFAEALEVAAERDDLAAVKWLFTHFSHCLAPVNVVVAAAIKGHLSVLQYLFEHDAGEEYPHVLRHQVSGDGDCWTECVPQMPTDWSWATGSGNAVTWGGHAMLYAVQGGHSGVAWWMFAQGLHEIDTETGDEKAKIIEAALQTGEVELAAKLTSPDDWEAEFTNRCPDPSGIKVMLDREYFHENRDAAAYAIWTLSRLEGHLDLMQGIAAVFDPPPNDDSAWTLKWQRAVVEACTRGDLPMVTWLVEHPTGRQVYGENQEHDELVMKAAELSSVEVLEYLYGRGVSDLSGRAVYHAARKGNLQSVKWLLSHTAYTKQDPPGSIDFVFEGAATHGHLEVLQYLFALDASSVPGHLPDVTRARNPMVLAARFGHLNLVKWLYETRSRGCNARVIDAAAGHGQIEVARWLHLNTAAECTKNAVVWAARDGHLDALKWLHTVRSDVCTVKVFEHAVHGGNLQTVYWLARHLPGDFLTKDNMSWWSEDKFEVLLFLFERCSLIFTQEFITTARREVLFCPEKVTHVEVVNWLEYVFEMLYS